MPFFPAVRYPGPCCLNPLNPRHYLFVAYWIYFCPSALKFYLYQASPDHYKKAATQDFFQALKVKAYRNLVVCVLPTIVLVALLLSLPALWILQVVALQGSAIAWDHWLLGLGVGGVIGGVYLIVYGVVLNATVNLAAGFVSGVVLGVATGVASAAVISVVLAVSPTWSIFSLFTTALWPCHLYFVVVFSVVFGGPIALGIGGLAGGIAGLVTGLSSGVLSSIVWHILLTAGLSIKAADLAYAVMLGLVCSGIYGFNVSLAVCLGYALLVGVMMGLAVCVGLYQQATAFDVSVINGLGVMLIIWAGAVRLLPIHFVYVLLAGVRRLFGGRWLGVQWLRHPLDWDELLLLPLPGAERFLKGALSTQDTQGLHLLMCLAKNPLQRPLVQRVFKWYLLSKPQFIRAMYRFIEQPLGIAYIMAPVTPNDWVSLPTGREVLLGEFNSTWVVCLSEKTSAWLEYVLARLTWWRRDHQAHRCTQFAKLLYGLSYCDGNDYGELGSKNLETEYLEAEYLEAECLGAQCSGFEGCLGSQEIIDSFRAMAAFAHYKEIHQFSEAKRQVATLPPVHLAIRPMVIELLNALADIAQDLAIAEDSRSLLLRQAALLRANNTLAQLYGRATVMTLPEKALILTVIQNWQTFITLTGGEVSELTKAKPLVKNPYIIGAPVAGAHFIGREDILRYVANEIVTERVQCPAIVLYGHRRMGKTSILKNLQMRLQSANIKVVDFNMQVLGHVSSTHELIYALASQLSRTIRLSCQTLSADRVAQLTLNIDRKTFLSQNPYHLLNNYLQSLESITPDYRFVVAIDEFEKLEEKILSGQLSKDLPDFLRGLTQTYGWFSIIFAGLHRIEEMSGDFWHPFFTSVPIGVSFLSPEATKRLILQTGDIAYAEEVVDEIVRLTHGQPYLVQLIGYTLIRFFNREQLPKCVNAREYPFFTADDLGFLVNSNEFYAIGNSYFQGVWSQAMCEPPTGQVAILKQLVKRPMSGAALGWATQLTPAALDAALKVLQAHDVIVCSGGCFQYTVELMRRWVARKQMTDEDSDDSV